MSVKLLSPCRACGESRMTALYPAPAFEAANAATFTLVRCECCELVRTEPALTEQELSSHYAALYYGAGQRKFNGFVEWFTRLDNQRRARRLLALLRNHMAVDTTKTWRILDIGCGRANLLAALARQGCECHGVERQEFPLHPAHTGIHFYREKLENLPFEAGHFDAIILWHVLEHVDDPSITLREAEKLLRADGILALAVPNFGSWQESLFKSAWFHLDLPRHTHHFNRSALERLLNRYAFQPFEVSTWAFDQNVFGFIQSMLNRFSPTDCANDLYTLLKDARGLGMKRRLLGWLIVTSFIVPLALIEYFVSGLLKKGATLIIYSKKTPNTEQ